jgi:hypothetical protein
MIDRLASLALLAMLALAPVNARAQSSPLTPEVLKKILQLMVSVGKDFESPAILATALGFTVAGQPWPNREIEAKESRPNFLHGFSETRGDEPDILITLRGLDSIRAFRAHRDGKIVRARFMILIRAKSLRSIQFKLKRNSTPNCSSGLTESMLFPETQSKAPQLAASFTLARPAISSRPTGIDSNRRLMQRSKERGYSTTSAAMIVPL